MYGGLCGGGHMSRDKCMEVCVVLGICMEIHYVSLCGDGYMYGDIGMEVCVVVGLFMEVRGQHAGVSSLL